VEEVSPERDTASRAPALATSSTRRRPPSGACSEAGPARFGRLACDCATRAAPTRALPPRPPANPTYVNPTNGNALPHLPVGGYRRRRDEGRCRECDSDAAPGRTRGSVCLARQRERQSRRGRASGRLHTRRLAPGKRPEHLFLRTIYDALAEDARREVTIALKVAVALEHGMGSDDIADRLGLTRGDVLAATKRVQRAREQLERGQKAAGHGCVARDGTRAGPGGASLQGKGRVGARCSTPSSMGGGRSE
jgi:hypothetical protein